MTNLWLKIKLWTKVVLFTLIGTYVLFFVAFNMQVRVQGELQFFFVSFQNPPVLMVMLVTAAVSVFGWWLIRTVLKTLRQFRAAQERTRTERLEKELAEIKAKASLLQPREPAPTSAAKPATDSERDPEGEES